MGLEATLRDTQQKGKEPSGETPIAYLATWLMRNNPKHSKEGKAKLEAFTAECLNRAELEDLADLEGRRAEDAALVLQAAHRGHAARLMAGEQKQAAKVVQAGMRGRAARREREAEHVAARNVQSHVRGHQARVEVQAHREAEAAAQQAAATAVQSVIRGHQQRAVRSAPARRTSHEPPPEPTAEELEAAQEASMTAAQLEEDARQAMAATKVQSMTRGRQARAARE